MISLALIAPLIFIQGCSQTDNFFVDQATFLDLEKHQEYQSMTNNPKILKLEDPLFLFKGHNLKSGSGTILTFRYRNKGELFKIDTAKFEYLTIYLPNGFGDKRDINLEGINNVIVFYSEGGVSFPTEGCFGYLDKGRIQLEKKTANNLYVSVDLEANLINPHGWNYCGVTQIKKSNLLVRKQLSDISPL